MVSRYNVSLQEKEHILSPSSSLVQQGCMAEKQGWEGEEEQQQ